MLRPFVGYRELEMWHEANDELEALPNEYKTRPEVLSARLELLMEMERWELDWPYQGEEGQAGYLRG